MADDPGRLAQVWGWCGMALIAGGVLMVVATLLHPVVKRYDNRCQRAEAGRGAYGLHACLVTGAARPSQTLCRPARRNGTAGIGRFLTASGTYLIAVTGTSLSSPRSWPNRRRRCWTP